MLQIYTNQPIITGLTMQNVQRAKSDVQTYFVFIWRRELIHNNYLLLNLNIKGSI